MADAGLVVLTSFISPFRAERGLARERIGEHFIEVLVDVPIEVAEERDPKRSLRQSDVRAGVARELHRHRLTLRTT